MAPVLFVLSSKRENFLLMVALLAALNCISGCEAEVISKFSSPSARRLLSGTGPNAFCPDADFPNQCYNANGNAYACCTGSCGPVVDNQASCADGRLGPTANPPANPPAVAPATPTPTPLSDGASKCPAGAFQNACFTPNGDAYVCCSNAGCGTPNHTTNTATCADNKYLPIVPAIYVFGDSLVDSGNAQYLGAGVPYPPMPPYGINPNGPNVEGRASDGPLLSDYIAEYLGLPFAPPILQPGANFFRGANFASAGSGALNTTSTALVGTVLPLLAQIDLFTQFKAKSAAYYAGGNAYSNPTPTYPPPTTFSSSLYVIVTGGNDLIQSLIITPNASQFAATATAVVANIATSVQTLYVAGARTLVVANIGEAGCAPYIRNISATGDCSSQVNAAVGYVNAALTSTLAKLRGALPGVTILELDTFNAGAAPLFIPGITNYNQACCGFGGPANTAIICSFPGYTVCSDPLAHYFWDFVHPTTQVSAAVANELATGNTFVSPSNLYQTLVVPKLVSR